MSKLIRYKKYYVVEDSVTGEELGPAYPTDPVGQQLAWKEYNKKLQSGHIRLVCKTVVNDPTEDVIWI